MQSIEFQRIKSSFFLGTHLLVTLFAWVAPFLISWKILLPAYALVMLQFLVFQRCLMNEQHGLGEQDDYIFYTEIVEKIGLRPNRRRLKMFVRRYLYLILGAVALYWQWYLEKAPVLLQL